IHDYVKLVENKKRAYVASHRNTFYPFVEALVKSLHDQHIPIGIVTASHGDQLRATVPAEFLAHFSAICTGDQFKNGKPHPEPYLTGAKILGIPIRQCIVVENAPFGVRSAKAAECQSCIGVTSTVDSSQLLAAGADFIARDMDEVRNYLFFGSEVSSQSR
ncbi:MAG: HAD family phosphatase, partial [Bdellovibrionota bacterium]